jgi:hypothetical protein
MKRSFGLVLVGAIALASSTASATPVPSKVPFTARLSDNSGPINGNVSLSFSIYDAASGGTADWTEGWPTATATQGLVFIDLGTNAPLDATVFNGGSKYLEITVNGTTLSPRLPIGSAPYAIHADTSDSVGSLTETDIQQRVTGTCVGQAISSVATNGSVSCTAIPQPTTYTGSNGVAVAGTTVGLSTAGCAAGYVWTYNGSSFVCQAQASTAYTGGTGIAVAGTTVSLSTTGCAAGYVWKYNGAAFACSPEQTYTGGTGITVSGNTVSLSTTGCAAGYVWTYNGASFACAAPATTTYTGGTGITVAGTTVSVDSTAVPLLSSANTFANTNSFNKDVTLGGAAPGSRLVRTGTGNSNLVPIAYGNVLTNGGIAVGSTPNFTVTHVSTGVYEVAINGESYSYQNYVTNVNLNTGSGTCAVATLSSVSGMIYIQIFLCNGTSVDEDFMFVTYKP